MYSAEIMNTKTNEELLRMIYDSDHKDAALGQLIENLTPMMVKIGRSRLMRIPYMDTDDYIQEGSIVLWSIIQNHKYNGTGKFSNLFYTVFDYKCRNKYRDYILKNWICYYESDDMYHYGYQTCIMAEDPYARIYRDQQKERNKRWYNKHKRKTPIEEGKPPLSPEEKKERTKQRRREYYESHREQMKAAKKKWYQEHREYALLYQKAYAQGVRIGKKGPAGKRTDRKTDDSEQ